MPWSIAFMVVMIVLITAIAKTARHRNHHAPGGTQAAPHEITHAQDEIRQLKQRVQVLERVVTENRTSLDLDREIARLRDH